MEVVGIGLLIYTLHVIDVVRFDTRLVIETVDGVYPPSEDTMFLLDAVRDNTSGRVLEIGTGSGVIALHLARDASVTATDVNPEAVRLARRNARSNNLELSVVRCDMFNGLRGVFDLIIFNPPYLKEDVDGGWIERAWRGGKGGIELTTRFLQRLPVHLATKGRAYLLITSDQLKTISTATELFDFKIVARKELFFEELMVLELSRKGALISDSNIEKSKETIK